MKEIRVFSPATVANVNCGFDVLGFALDGLGDEMVIRKVPEKGIKITEQAKSNRPTSKENPSVIRTETPECPVCLWRQRFTQRNEGTSGNQTRTEYHWSSYKEGSVNQVERLLHGFRVFGQHS